MEEADKDWMTIRMVVGECFFWYRRTHTGSPGQRAIKWLLLLLLLYLTIFVSGAEMRLVRWMCDVKVKYKVPSKELRERDYEMNR